jgi:hypothetical protein
MYLLPFKLMLIVETFPVRWQKVIAPAAKKKLSRVAHLTTL